ncbi:carbon starvation protein A [Sporanaerobium hydrogeniformans]|uniref:Carbon starvation protein A n=1 Tax=Sporanaerobium hydrogeniformans TaxID=3072179 RepID=A0AC61DAY1_9FIRM|nr:carbon starvation protein A [Sporanaerobium hydrogeniformans]PHV70394.1 carbon starvation protein A [Sporanaerobium hydrogeniformans]
MNSLLLLVLAVVIFGVAYIVYGGWLVKKWGIDVNRETPAKTKFDNVDYVPTDAKVLVGHHFSSIAGAGPITGPILAAVFGWLPVYLWIIIGSIFIGGVHDFGALFASIRHDGKSIGEIIKINIGKRGKILFNIFAYATLILVVAAFTDICATTFAFDATQADKLTGAQSGTASILFIFLAVFFGVAVYRKNVPISIATVAGVTLLFLCILIGYYFPILKLSKGMWNVILIIYIAAASILPVWILLQPRDYLCSFLLYAMLAGGVIGVILYRPHLVTSAYNGFTVGGQTLFPFLFVTVACGAISGFHSLVSSGTTAKQIKNEKDAQLIGYGSMLIEGIVAVIALITFGYISNASELGAPAAIFAAGLAQFMNQFGLPVNVGVVFVTLSFSAFALTSLDTATRIGRYLFQEIFEDSNERVRKFFGNSVVATVITVALASILLGFGYKNIWPIFGASNQLLGSLALLAITAWLAKSNKQTLMTVIPMVFMFCVTIVALILVVKNNILAEKPNYLLAIIAVILFVLAILIVIEGISKLFKKEKGIESVEQVTE